MGSIYSKSYNTLERANWRERLGDVPLTVMSFSDAPRPCWPPNGSILECLLLPPPDHWVLRLRSPTTIDRRRLQAWWVYVSTFLWHSLSDIFLFPFDPLNTKARKARKSGAHNLHPCMPSKHSYLSLWTPTITGESSSRKVHQMLLPLTALPLVRRPLEKINSLLRRW